MNRPDGSRLGAAGPRGRDTIRRLIPGELRSRPAGPVLAHRPPIALVLRLQVDADQLGDQHPILPFPLDGVQDVGVLGRALADARISGHAGTGRGPQLEEPDGAISAILHVGDAGPERPSPRRLHEAAPLILDLGPGLQLVPCSPAHAMDPVAPVELARIEVHLHAACTGSGAARRYPSRRGGPSRPA